MERDQVIQLFDRTKINGMGYMVLLWLLNGATIGELNAITGEDRHTIGQALKSLEIRSLLVRVQSGHAEKWYCSQQAQVLLCDPQLAGIPPASPTTTTAIEIINKDHLAVAEARSTGGNLTSKPIDPQLVAAFRAAGIGANMHAELAALEWMSVPYIRAHAKACREQRKSVGLLITRLRMNDPMPKNNEPPTNLGKNWQSELKKYRSGKKRL